jgi:hypothetical protein
MKKIILIVLAIIVMAPMAQSETYQRPYRFDIHGCKRHLKSIAKAVKDAGGEVKKNDSSDRSYQMTLNGKTTIYTCTKHELLETEL